MPNKLMIAAASVIITGVTASLIATRNQSRRFRKEVEQLFAQDSVSAPQTFSPDQLSGLPEPVQRYFRHVLPEGQPYIRYVRLKHDGWFKTAPDKDWVSIEGAQYFTTDPPGFIWQGKTHLFTAHDQYLNGQGRLAVWLLSLLKVVDTRGESVKQGELLRWLGESAWFPTNLLPNDHLNWLPVDANSAKLTFEYDNLSLYYLVDFNEQGEIIRMETKRYMEADRLETWVGELSDYRSFQGIRIPTAIQGTWKLKEGDYTYADFRLKDIEFDRPEKYDS